MLVSNAIYEQPNEMPISSGAHTLQAPHPLPSKIPPPLYFRGMCPPKRVLFIHGNAAYRPSEGAQVLAAEVGASNRPFASLYRTDTGSRSRTDAGRVPAS